jgi:hypothetical protein
MTDLSTTVKGRDNNTALTLIDHAIRECAGRDIVSAAEMTDFLLDIRVAYLAILERTPTL